MKASKKFSLAKITGKYIGKSFGEMPCHLLLNAIYNNDLKLGLPTGIEHITLENASAYFKQERDKTIAYMMRLFRTLGQPVPVDELKIFDLVVARQLGSYVFPGIYVGRRKIITSTHQEGVVLAALGRFNRAIMARRVL